jgi:holo-[acyl-carrier protein] synthase
VVGIDLVDLEDVVESIRAHGERYLQRIYDEHERRDCGWDARALATRFAAKEATMKVLQPRDVEVPWRSIGVRVDASGTPWLELTGPAASLARLRGITNLSLTFTHTKRAAAAVVRADRRR